MNKIVLCCFLAFFSLAGAQESGGVGINTTEPEATLDVNGNLIVREVEELVDYPYEILVRNLQTHEIQSIPAMSGGGGETGSFSDTYAKLSSKDELSLHDEEGEGFEGWRRINFHSYMVQFDPGNNLDTDSDDYIVPSDGTYQIIYELKLGSGMIMSNKDFSAGQPNMGIFTERYGSFGEIDAREFSSTSIELAENINLNTVITNYTMNSFYAFDEGERISFLVSLQSLPEELLSDCVMHIMIRKVSDYRKVPDKKAKKAKKAKKVS